MRSDFTQELSAVRDIDLAWLEILARVILQSDPARICKPCLHDLSCAAEFSLLRKEPAKKVYKSYLKILIGIVELALVSESDGYLLYKS